MDFDNNSDEIYRAINKHTLNLINDKILEICEGEGLNFPEIAEKYSLSNTSRLTESKPKKGRKLTTPIPSLRCIAIASEGHQCKRSKKDGTDFCRRHVHKQSYGTIHDKPLENNKIEKKIEIVKPDNTNSNIENNLEIEHKGNEITLEDGTQVIFIPTTGQCYSYHHFPKLLGTLNPDNKTLIPI